MVREMSLMYPSFPLPVFLLGLRYLEAFFGMLIAVMCGMFGWMVRGRGRGRRRREGERTGERRGWDGGREKRKGGREEGGRWEREEEGWER